MAILTPLQAARTNPELRNRATQVLQQTAQGRLDLPKEQTKISDEFLDELSKTTQNPPDHNLDALLNAVTQNFVDRKAGEAQDSPDQKKMEVEWAPEVRPGEIMAPQGYTGQLIYKESKEQPKDQAIQPAAKAKPAASSNPGSKKTDQAKQPKSNDTVELTAESQKMAQKMQQGGMQPAGVDSKGGKQGGAKPEERVDVFMPTAGVTQLVEVSQAGQLRSDGLLGTYRKLDDMPSFNGAYLRKRTGKEVVEDHNARRQQGQTVEPLTQAQQQQLLNPVATHQ